MPLRKLAAANAALRHPPYMPDSPTSYHRRPLDPIYGYSTDAGIAIAFWADRGFGIT